MLPRNSWLQPSIVTSWSHLQYPAHRSNVEAIAVGFDRFVGQRSLPRARCRTHRHSFAPVTLLASRVHKRLGNPDAGEQGEREEGGRGSIDPRSACQGRPLADAPEQGSALPALRHWPSRPAWQRRSLESPAAAKEARQKRHERRLFAGPGHNEIRAGAGPRLARAARDATDPPPSPQAERSVDIG